MTYTTKAGDMFDSIAYERLGSCRYTPLLIKNNPAQAENFVFNAGVELELPTIEQKNTTTAKLPPWKK